MKMHSISYIVFMTWSILYLSSNSPGQETLMQMKASELRPSNVIPIDPYEVILVIRSVIKNLNFQTNHGRIDVREERPGEWWLLIEPGTHLITFSAKGFQSITVRVYIPLEERSRELEIGPIESPLIMSNKDLPNNKQNSIINFIITSIIIGVIVGVTILLIEYHSGLFFKKKQRRRN